jgi:hypothetical protein
LKVVKREGEAERGGWRRKKRERRSSFNLAFEGS